MNTVRTARGNRLGLALTGLLVLLAGGYLITRSLGVFGSSQAQDPIYSDEPPPGSMTNARGSGSRSRASPSSRRSWSSDGCSSSFARTA